MALQAKCEPETTWQPCHWFVSPSKLTIMLSWVSVSEKEQWLLIRVWIPEWLMKQPHSYALKGMKSGAHKSQFILFPLPVMALPLQLHLLQLLSIRSLNSSAIFSWKSSMKTAPRPPVSTTINSGNWVDLNKSPLFFMSLSQ